MNNSSHFHVGNIKQGYYLVGGAWLSNFCNCFSNHLGTYSSKMETLRKLNKSCESAKEGERKIAA